MMWRWSLMGRCSIGLGVVLLLVSTAQAQIVNGTATLDHRAVGALLAGADASAATVRCSGTMIGCETFLTANHCVDGNLDESFYHVYLQSEGILPVTAISDAPSYPDGRPADLVLLTLGDSIESTRPILPSDSVHAGEGFSGQIVGFGVTAPKVNDHGIKRSGEIETKECGRNGDGRICWAFDGSKATTCNIDSGGPLLFADSLGQSVVGGVTMGGDSQCGTVGEYIDTDVGFFLDWILDEAGEDLFSLDCGSPSLTLSSNLGFPLGYRFLAPGQREDHFFVIPDTATEVQVSLNGQDDPDLDFDLEALIHRADWSVSDYCAGDGEGRFASCRLEVSSDDAIVAVSVSMLGDDYGSYQLVVTAL